ncbi:MAG: TRAP transporter small permease [Burkholderiales bacterium]|nr:MAG: TRAP transporter small permease [Burkholderiales bacterium]
MRAFLRAIDRDGERYLMLVFYCTIVFVIVTEVIRRFVLSYSSLWGEEVARYAFIYLGWVGASYAVKVRAHIRFDVILQLLPARLHGYVYIFGDIATMVFACFAMYWSLHTIGTLLEFDAKSYALRINKAWFEAAIPLGFAMMMVRLVQSFIRDVRDLRAGRKARRGALLFD